MTATQAPNTTSSSDAAVYTRTVDNSMLEELKMLTIGLVQMAYA